MAYKIHTRTDKRSNYHSPAEARAYYGKYSRGAICVHWWNSPDKVKDSDHDNIVNYIYNKGTSVHYVVSNKKITKMVDPDNVAWHASNGNPITIGIEFSPHLNTEGYKRGGWLISELEKKYGRTLKFYKHSDFVSTTCPGSISLPKLRSEADKFKKTSKGVSMAKATLTTARMLAHSILGSSGAMSGKRDADLQKHHVGAELDNGYIQTLYGSTEAKKYREHLAQLVRDRDEAQGKLRSAIKARDNALKAAERAEKEAEKLRGKAGSDPDAGKWKQLMKLLGVKK